MPFANKRADLERFYWIPLLCVQCSLRKTIAQPDGRVLDVLYEVSTLREFQYELKMLQRTKTLFGSFPNSRHPLKMHKEFRSKDERSQVEADPELAEAINADPELEAFLRHSSFWLPGRTKFVTEAIERWLEPDVHLIQCTRCESGYFCIEPTFFENMFSTSTYNH